MKTLFGKAVTAVLGLTLTLGYWSFTGGGRDVEVGERIPKKVWEGGGGTLTVQVESSSPGTMRISFNDRKDERSLETYEKVSAGSYRWSVDVPRGAGGYVEFGADKPQVGDTLSWTIMVNGSEVDSQSSELEAELGHNEAFFIQSYFEDYSTGAFEED